MSGVPLTPKKWSLRTVYNLFRYSACLTFCVRVKSTEEHYCNESYCEGGISGTDAKMLSLFCHIDTGIYLPGVYDFLQFTRRSSNPFWNSTCGASSHWSRLTFQFLLKLIIVFLEGNIVLSSNQVRGFSTKFSAFQNKWMDKMVQSIQMKLGPQELVSALPINCLFCHKKGRSMLLRPSLRFPIKMWEILWSYRTSYTSHQDFICPSCMKSFNSPGELQSHFDQQHETQDNATSVVSHCDVNNIRSEWLYSVWYQH